MAARYTEEEINILTNIATEEDRTMEQIVCTAAERLPHRTPRAIRAFVVKNSLPYIRVRQRYTEEMVARLAEVYNESGDVVMARVGDVSTIDRPAVVAQNRLSLTGALEKVYQVNRSTNL